ncbi:ABC transporter substrate-binding protein [Nocardioides sp. URHA0020]|uniref:ABC transporter substrate-binding protein n=1 Tax=Nocardioides sp. URHA0020 TaxID=1380392 RepID=UPI000B16D52E|nr:extracellular solute-binding protein [Nocardioides sp. URHA0020]
MSAAALLALTACGGSGGGGSSSGGGDPQEFSFLINAENTTIPDELTTLSKDQCKAENKDLPLKIETVPQTQLDQKLQLLAGQDALPVSFAAGNTPALTETLDKDGQLLDFEKTFTDLGVIDQISPAAISTIKSLYGGKFNVLPYQYNIEGFWYNKKIFADNGLEVPQTYDDLVSDAAALDEAGVQPFSASGEQGWPLTRLISGYLSRELGPDAMQRIKDGDAKLTDPEYVDAAQKIADLGDKGYFGKGLGSIDYDTAINTFLKGDAGILYMGSWVLGSFADESLNKIGSDNIGFFPFPNVEGGAGSSEQLPANVGLPMAFSAKQYNKKVGAWLKCIAENYGQASLEDQNSISGFVPATTPELDPLTKLVQDTVDKTTESTLWFEALFGSKATTVSQTNAAPLVSGDQSPEDFMKKVQDAQGSK